MKDPHMRYTLKVDGRARQGRLLLLNAVDADQGGAHDAPTEAGLDQLDLLGAHVVGCLLVLLKDIAEAWDGKWLELLFGRLFRRVQVEGV
jgi:hypothetical protein